MRVGIIGAGPAGITAGYELAHHGIEVEIFEAGSAVGGLARTIRLWDHLVDLGPHRFFSGDPRVNNLWEEVMGDEYVVVKRLTRILYNGAYFDYPLRAADVLRKLGPVEAFTCLASYLHRQVAPKEERGDFGSWVENRFGSRLFEIFFKSYSEKLWGLKCDRIDSDFAAQRIRGFNLGQAVLGALSLGRQQHKTLVDEFVYPKKGSGQLYERMASCITALGGSIALNCPIRRVLVTGEKVRGVELENGIVRDFDHVISTMPLTRLVASLPDCPIEVQNSLPHLKFRNTLLVYLLVDRPDLFPDQWLYIHAPELKVGRITNFRNWSPSLCEADANSVLSLEYWCNEDDADWQMADASLVDRAVTELKATGLASAAKVIDGKVIRISKCYPVYEKGYKNALLPIKEYLARIPSLQVIGRYGSFKYNNQDHSILMGLLAAKNILERPDFDLWEVNSDYDTYQEKHQFGYSDATHARESLTT